MSSISGIFDLLELYANRILADKIIEYHVIVSLFANASRDDARIDAKSVRIDPARFLRHGEAGEALVPFVGRDQGFQREIVGLRFNRIGLGSIFFVEEVELQPVEQMQEDVSQFMEQDEPKVIQPVVAQRECNNRLPGLR